MNSSVKMCDTLSIEILLKFKFLSRRVIFLKKFSMYSKGPDKNTGIERASLCPGLLSKCLVQPAAGLTAMGTSEPSTWVAGDPKCGHQPPPRMQSLNNQDYRDFTMGFR